ncbi:HAMP domain-containing histidine kinase [Vibrio sp.]|nr:HAMP domain-containing histidine kinase [Vibrio sp.]
MIVSSVSALWRNHSLFRLSLLVVLLMWTMVAISLTSVYWLSIKPIEQSRKQRLDQHILQITTLYQTNPTMGFDQLVDQFTYSSEGFITLARDEHDRVSGSLSHFPKPISACPQLTSFPIWGGLNRDIGILHGCTFPLGEGKILVASSQEELTEFKTRFLYAGSWVLLIAAILSFIPSWIVKRKIQRQLDTISYVVTEIELGNFSVRAKVSNQSDEWGMLAQQLNRLLDRVEGSVNQIQGVTDAIAHDLRTPMTRIKNKLQALEGGDSERIQKGLYDIEHEFDAILLTFNALLELSKLENGNISASFHRVNLKTIVHDAIELIEPEIEEKGQTLHFEIQDLTIKGDPSLLFRMVYNLLDNAMKYTPEGGEISLTLNATTLMISDTGDGIPDSEKEKVFERLYRMDQSRHEKGYGLGLPLVAAVAKVHNAALMLMDNSTSQVHSGLVVKIEFVDRR